MMDFRDLITRDAVVTGFAAGTKKQLFQRLGELAQRVYAIDSGEVFDRLLERERLGSTGFGEGVAIPHAKIAGLDHVRALVVRLDQPIGFDSIDGAPVDIVFALLSPVESGAEHLKVLARVSRYLRNGANVARLRGAGSAEAMLALLSDEGARDAA